MEVFEQLKQEALYAQRSLSEELLYQTYGKAQMARQLGALEQAEFMELNHMTIYFMNTDRDFIRSQSEFLRPLNVGSAAPSQSRRA